MAGRATLSWTPEARYGAKGRALLQRPAASGQRTLSSCRESRQQGTAVSDGQSFSRPVWALPTRQWLSLWESWREAPERANKNRAAGNVRTCGAVYLLEEIVLVENGSLNPVGTIRIVYFIWRKKSTRVAKIGGTCSCTKQNTLKSLDSKVFQTGAAIQIRTGDLILTKDALYQLSYSSKWRPGSGSNRRPPA